MLKAKYEGIKKELRKSHGAISWQKTGGGPCDPPPPPLLDEEEKSLLNNIMLSVAGLAPGRGDADSGYGKKLV